MVLYFILIIASLVMAAIVFFFARRYFFKRLNEEVDKRVDEYIKLKEKAFEINEGFDTQMPVSKADKQKFTSKKYDCVTVLFADIQGFTKIVEHLNPDRLIDELDKFFFQFDNVIEKYKIEKIKTIGDAYMAAGGLPRKNSTNPIEVVIAALEIQEHMIHQKADQRDFWELRIGVHTGPVVLGKVGRSKINIDIWGDTVNIASRMESSGVAGEINITGMTYQLVKDFFDCEYRGKMPIKYKGEIDMYFVRNILPKLSVGGFGKKPNELFLTRLQHIRFDDITEVIMERLNNELSPRMTYHTADHTADVILQIEILGSGEKVTEEEMLILKTAALMHDTGFLISYTNHESKSIELAKEILPTYQYTFMQIDKIVKLIEITKHKEKPVNKLECIMKDADLDYVGRSDYQEFSDKLFKEVVEFEKDITYLEWTKYQYDFFVKHQFYTETAKKLRQAKKDKHLEILKRNIK
ncbi:MAG: guanylate cyclase [Marinilabiliaceae bacterium]|nr:guanylate cyclase [Marinilabiliaceae bacterium]